MSTVKSYNYTDADGNTQAVDVTVQQTACTKVAPDPDPFETGFEELSESTITITLSKPLPEDIYIYFERSRDRIINRVQNVDAGQVTFKLPRGRVNLEYTYFCYSETYGSPSIITEVSYTFLDQPVTVTNAEDKEEDPPEERAEIPYSAAPTYVFEFDKPTKGYSTKTCRVEVYNKNFAGTTKEVLYMQARPLSIRTSGNTDDLYRQVYGSQLQLNLLAFQQNEYRDLFTSNDADAKILYYEDDLLMWEGFNVAEFYRTNASTTGIQTVQVLFTDGIAILKDKKFKWATDTPRQKQIDVIWHILQGIGSSLPLMDKVYYYPATINYSITKSPLEYLEVDIRTYKDDDDQSMSCYEVLEALLGSYKARISTSWNKDGFGWFVDDINSRTDSNLYWRRYENGASTASGTIYNDSRKILDRSSEFGNTSPGTAIIINRSRNQVVKPQVHLAKITKDLEYIPDLVPNFDGDYSFGESGILGWTEVGDIERSVNVSGDSSRRYLVLPSKTYSYTGPPPSSIQPDESVAGYFPLPGENYIESDEVDIYAEGGNKVSISFRVACSAQFDGLSTDNLSRILDQTNYGRIDSFLPIQVIVENSTDTYWLNNQRTWDTSENYLYVDAQSYSPDGLGQEQFFTYTIADAIIPADGQFKVRIWQPSSVRIYRGFTFETIPVTWDLADIITNYETTVGFLKTKETLTAEASIKTSQREYETTVIHADVDSLQNVSALTVDGDLTTTWEKYRDYEKPALTASLAQLVGQSIIENQYSPDQWIIEGLEFMENGADELGSPYSFTQVVGFTDLPGRRFICYDYEYTPRHDQYLGYGAYIRATYVEVTDAKPDVRYYIDSVDQKSNRSRAGSGGSGGSSTTTIYNENDYDIRTNTTPAEVAQGIPVYFNVNTGKLVIDQADLPTFDGAEPDGNNYLTGVSYNGTNGIDFTRQGLETITLPVPTLERVTSSGKKSFENIQIEKTSSVTGGNLVEFINNSGSAGYKLGGFSVYNEGAVGGVYITRADESFRANFAIELREGTVPLKLFEINYNTVSTDHEYKLLRLGGTGNRFVYADENGVLGNWALGNLLEISGSDLQVKGNRTANKIQKTNSNNDGLEDSIISDDGTAAIFGSTTNGLRINNIGVVDIFLSGDTVATFTSQTGGQPHFQIACDELRTTNFIRTGNPAGLSSAAFKVGKTAGGNLLIVTSDGTTYQITPDP